MADVDFAKIKRNVKKLVDGGATREKIDMYLGHEGVTKEQVRNYKAPGMLETAATFVKDTVIGKQDPRFADTPDFASVENLSLDKNPVTMGAKAFGEKDSQYADIIEQNLKEVGRFVGREKDENGYDIISYKNDLGEVEKAYANRPGLDWQDVDRGITQAAKYGLAASGVGKLFRGVGLVGKIIGQAAVGTGVSAGSDIAAKGMGSKQDADTFGIDPTKAVVTGVTAGLFEGLSPLVAAGVRKMFGPSQKYVDDAGNFTKEGRKLAEDIGLNPDDVTPEVALQFRQDLTKAASQKELGAKTRTDEFEILTSKGQRTKDPEAVLTEEAMRKGVHGQDASYVMKNFDAAQKESIQKAALEKVGQRFDPEAQAAGGQATTDLADIGGRVREGLQTGLKQSRTQEKKLWDGLGDLDATPEAKALIPQMVREKVENLGVLIDDNLHPVSTKLMDDLFEYSQGNTLSSPHKILEGSKDPVTTIRHMQRRILSGLKSAEKDDKAVAGQLYSAFNDWVTKIADDGMVGGNALEASRLKAARAFTRQEREIFQPTDKMGKNTPAANILSKILDDNNESPEAIISIMFGESGAKGKPKPGVVQAIKHMMRVVDRAEKQGIDEIAQMGSGLRVGYWTSLITNKRGDVLTPKMMKGNIETALNKQQSVLKELYSKEEINLMRRFSKTLEDATADSINASGTSFASAALKRQSAGKGGAAGLAKNFATAGQRKAVFSDKNFLMARFYELLRENIARVSGISAEKSARRQAADLTAQTIDKRLLKTYPKITGPLAGQVGIATSE